MVDGFFLLGQVWDVATNSVVHDLRGHHQAVDGLVWLSPHQLASSSAADGTVRLWNTQLAEPHGHAQAPLDHVSPKQVRPISASCSSCPIPLSLSLKQLFTPR